MMRDSTGLDEHSRLGRMRSAALLGALILVLGLLTAATLGTLVVAVTTLLDHALG